MQIYHLPGGEPSRQPYPGPLRRPRPTVGAQLSLSKLAQTHNTIPSLLVLGLGLGNDVLRERDALLGLEPALDEPVAEVLLVERVLGLADLVSRSRPVAGRVGGERLVDEDQLLAVGRVEEAELELGVGEDEAAREGVLGSLVWALASQEQGKGGAVAKAKPGPVQPHRVLSPRYSL